MSQQQLNEKEILLPITSPNHKMIPRETRILGLTRKQLSLIILVIQNSTLVLMMRYSRIRQKPGENMYMASTAVYLAEVVKIIACLGVLLYQKKSFGRFCYVVQKEILGQPHETLKMFIPSALYALQNNLLYVALSNLEAATFQVTYQMKILSTAVFSVVLLERKLTYFKWFALILLMIGVTLVQLQTVSPVKPSTKVLNTDNLEEESTVAATAAAQLLLAQNPLIGLFAVITSCVSSGFAGCYFEKILKKTDTSMWIRNIQLGITGALFSLIGMIFYDSYAILNGGFLQGYDSLTYAVIANQALGGLLVAIVVKYADSILKGFATSLSIIISGIISFYWFDFHPTIQFIIGAIIVIISTYLYGRPDRTPKTLSKVSDS
ncbi:nucleotide-sugar transporter-domain-containing protein [Gigaspora rosea]|uniref:Nucleotide-sugar transporter-domain-containing protein n=1 Tax=Gigaspora rosea TaxID=44941 RepID=A0A397VCJ5_9GLOM|nr:nucleotide-sugar transporter-domain-containing protein [Gigaspora rosea]